MLSGATVHGGPSPERSAGEHVWELHHPKRAVISRVTGWDPGSGRQSGVEEHERWECRKRLAAAAGVCLQLRPITQDGQISTEVRHPLLWDVCAEIMLRKVWMFNTDKMCFSFYIKYKLSCLSLSRFVSDKSPAGCQALLQHRLIQGNQKTQLGSGSSPETARTYPLSLLEWTANRKKANMVLHVHCFDGEVDAALTFCSPWDITSEHITNVTWIKMVPLYSVVQHVSLFI